MTGPRRRSDTHVHPDYWARDDQRHYEARVHNELQKLEKAVDRLTQRVTLLLGGIGLLVFVIPIISPWVRTFVGVP